MKKTLLAAAALVAVSGSAFAQSSVTLYGVLDASLENVKASSQSVTKVSSDNYATSRLGFKGTEDLGGGLKAIFALEHNVKVDTGAQGNSARFWDRAAWVGLAGDFGDIRLGRIDSSIGALAGNTSILGAQAYDDLRIANTLAGAKYRRVDNAITYSLPTLVTGLTAQLQYSLASGTTATVPTFPTGTTGVATGTEAANDDTGKAFSASLQYVTGPIGVGAAYISAKTNTSGSIKETAALGFASYDFGAAKLTGYYSVDGSIATVVRQEKKEVLGIKVGVPISNDFSLTAGVSRVRNALGSSADDDATIVAIKGVYNLSKRTAVYGLLTTISNSAGSNLTVAGATVSAPVTAASLFDANSHGVAVGVRHAF